jgi:hypothetical protein
MSVCACAVQTYRTECLRDSPESALQAGAEHPQPHLKQGVGRLNRIQDTAVHRILYFIWRHAGTIIPSQSAPALVLPSEVETETLTAISGALASQVDGVAGPVQA